VVDLEGKIFALAVELIEDAGVAESMANGIFQRCKAYRGFPHKHYKHEQSTEECYAKMLGAATHFSAPFFRY